MPTADEVMSLWQSASYERCRRTLKLRDEPVALLIPKVDASDWICAINSHMTLLAESHGKSYYVTYPLPPDAIARFDGCPVFSVPWLQSGSYAWAWGP